MELAPDCACDFALAPPPSYAILEMQRGRGYTQAKRLFMLIRGYFDAASKEEFPEQPLMVAGTVATEAGWAEFSRAWGAALEIHGPAGITHFHTVDYAHCNGDFRPWKAPEKDRCDPRFDAARRRLLEELVEVMRRNIMFACAFWIKPADYNAVAQEYRLETEFWSGAYSFAVTYATLLAEKWAAKHFPTFEMFNVLEMGDTGQGKYLSLMHWYQSLGMAPPWAVLPEYDSKADRWNHPFGASDFVAYEHSLALNRKICGDSRPVRGSLVALRRAVPHWLFGYATQDNLRDMCESMPELYPRLDGQVPSQMVNEVAEAHQRRVIEGRQQIAVAERQVREMLRDARKAGLQLGSIDS